MAGKHDTKAQHKESVGFLLLALLILALVAGLAVIGVWYWQQQEVNRLNERIDQLGQQQAEETGRLNERVAQLDKDLAAAKAAAEKPPAEEPAEPTEPAASNKYTSPKGVALEVDTPAKGAKVTSPLTVRGRVPGNWSFEANFAVILKDGAGNILSSVPAQLLGDWMTTELVPFEATLVFTSPGSGSGQLILVKNNASALPENDDGLIIPVSF